MASVGVHGKVSYVSHGNVQFAGEIGLLSLGVGKDHKRYSIGGMYGIVPAELAGGPVIETFTVRQTYEFYDWKRLSFYGGLNIFHVVGVRYQTSRYGESPKSYYPIGSIRGLLNLGLNYWNAKAMNALYFEAGLNDIWIVNSLANSQQVNPGDHVSLALGYKVKF